MPWHFVSKILLSGIYNRPGELAMSCGLIVFKLLQAHNAKIELNGNGYMEYPFNICKTVH